MRCADMVHKTKETRGWWELNTTIKPDTTSLEHIAQAIEQGNTGGEIINHDDDDEDSD